MSYLYITIIVLFLYLKTYKYKYCIDDHVPRSGMYVTIPAPPVPKVNGVFFDDQQKSYLATFTNIGTHLLVCWLIIYLWGWQVALLYAIMPTNVIGVAWCTGNYYMTTVFLVLTSYYFLSYDWGIIPAVVFFWGALHSTVSAIGLVAISFLYPFGWLMIVPLSIFLTGERFRTGLKKRKKNHDEMGYVCAKINWKNPILVIEILTYYILLSTGFMPMGFFHLYGRKEILWEPNRYFLMCLVLFCLFCFFGYLYNPFALFWWLMFMGVFSHAIPNLGQLVTERYMLIANIGFCMLVCSYLEQFPHIYWLLVGVWFMITLGYIPAWRSNESLFSQGIISFPESPDNYVNYASYLMDRQQYLRAVPHLTAALKFSRAEKYKIYGDIAVCYTAYGEHEKAILTYQLALKDADPVTGKQMDDEITRLKELIKNKRRK